MEFLFFLPTTLLGISLPGVLNKPVSLSAVGTGENISQAGGE